MTRGLTSTGLPLQSVVGFRALFGAFLSGLLFFIATTSMIISLANYGQNLLCRTLRGNLALPVLASTLLISAVHHHVDWTRWWVMITLDVAIVYILYAVDRPEIEQYTSRNVQVFVCTLCWCWR